MKNTRSVASACISYSAVYNQFLFFFKSQSFPASSKLHQIQEFQTEVLHSQMEYLLAGNLLANPGKVLTCICSFTAKVVDKLWQGTFLSAFEIGVGFVT